MKRREVIINGQTDNKGNFLISNKSEMKEFFHKWEESFFIMTIEKIKTENISQPLIAYYKKKIVPDMQRAYLEQGERYTQEQTDANLREMSTLLRKEKYNLDSRKWESEILEIEDLENQQLVFFIEEIKEIASINFGVYIEDPNSLI